MRLCVLDALWSSDMLFCLVLWFIAVPARAGIFESLNPFTGLGLDTIYSTVTNATIAEDQPSIFVQQENEKTSLQRRLQRNAGKWDSSHPRHRLLSALYGYSRHREKNQESVNRWREFYKRIPKTQRKVC